jgi:hypothetical protein
MTSAVFSTATDETGATVHNGAYVVIGRLLHARRVSPLPQLGRDVIGHRPAWPNRLGGGDLLCHPACSTDYVAGTTPTRTTADMIAANLLKNAGVLAGCQFRPSPPDQHRGCKDLEDGWSPADLVPQTIERLGPVISRYATKVAGA